MEKKKAANMKRKTPFFSPLDIITLFSLHLRAFLRKKKKHVWWNRRKKREREKKSFKGKEGLCKDKLEEGKGTIHWLWRRREDKTQSNGKTVSFLVKMM